MENTTLLIAALFECNGSHIIGSIQDPLIRDSLIGCRLLKLLQEMYQFGIAYDIRGVDPTLTDNERRLQLYPKWNNSVDLYVRPMTLRKEILDIAYPIEAILLWRSGFLIRRPDFGLFHSFYSEPFSRAVWYCIYVYLLVTVALFFALHYWDRRIFGVDDHECSFAFELFMAVGAMCQHYLPVNPRLVSRRVAYFSFFFFTYIMYAFYTSNLLSHLVSDRDNQLDLDGLADSPYKCVVLDSMKMIVEDSDLPSIRNLLSKKFKVIETTNTTNGVKELASGNTAVLSDYVTLYPGIEKSFEEEAICQLLEVDMYKNIKKYLFTSREFPFKEEFKIGTLRALETGSLRRIIQLNQPTPPICTTKPQIRTQFVHISMPLSILGVTYILASVILLAEKIFFERNRLFPYTD